MKKNKGITLIALVVTIVVLLILAGVSISMLTGDNGIITQAQNAKNQTIIGKEKESIDLAKVAIYSRDEEIAKDNMQNELDEIEGTNKTDVKLSEDGKSLEIKFLDSGNIYYVDINQTTGDGNYVVDGTIYCGTLTEAVEKAQDGSTIKVVKDSTEIESVTIDKSITIDTNGKTITFEENYNVDVSESYKLILKGNGSIIRYGGSSTLIANEGILEIEDVNIISDVGNGGPQGTIGNCGSLTINSGRITGQLTNLHAGNCVVNDGEIDMIYNHNYGGSSLLILNGGIIQKLKLNTDTISTINGGKITELIEVMDDCKLTIGDINSEVNTNNPEIARIEISGMLDYQEYNFCNGIIRGSFWNDSEDASLYNIRTGYKIQENYNAETGLNEYILVPNT